MKNWGDIPILMDLVGVLPRNIQTKFEANGCIGLREVKMLYNIVTYIIHCKYACCLSTKKLISSQFNEKKIGQTNLI